MKLTKNRIQSVLQRYEQLLDLAENFARERRNGGRSGSEIRINYNYNEITWEVNTACHCHPEYERVSVGTVDEFIEWINKKGY